MGVTLHKNIKEKFGLPSYKTTKLIPTHFNKEKYVLRVRNLELYIELGLELTEIHSAIQFNESPLLAEYINFNTEERKQAKNDFEKDYFKLMNNSVFGKPMEKIKKENEFQTHKQ